MTLAAEQDLLDAIQHADLYGDQGWTLDDFDIVDLGLVPLKDIAALDDFSSWVELEKGADDEELDSFRGRAWADRARQWGSSPPPIVVIDAPVVSDGPGGEVVQVGDGRGRVNYAIAKGLKKLPVTRMTFKYAHRPRKNPAPERSKLTFGDVAKQIERLHISEADAGAFVDLFTAEVRSGKHKTLHSAAETALLKLHRNKKRR